METETFSRGLNIKLPVKMLPRYGKQIRLCVRVRVRTCVVRRGFCVCVHQHGYQAQASLLSWCQCMDCRDGYYLGFDETDGKTYNLNTFKMVLFLNGA